MKKQYPTIDFLKFVFSICVVAIHTSLLDVNSSLSAWLVSSLVFRSAVPFFFVTSGYFFAGKIYLCDRNNRDSVLCVSKSYCEKLLPPLIVWGGIGLLLNAIEQYLDGYGWVRIIFYALQTIFYPRNAMWYLLASIIGVLLITQIYLRLKNWKVWLLITGIVGYIVVLLCNNYFFLIEDTFIGYVFQIYLKVCKSARNGLFLAPIFLAVGFYLRLNRVQDWMRNHKKHLIFGMFIGVVLLLTEAICVYGLSYADDRGLFISQLILIPSIVAVSICYDMKLKLPYRLLRRLSTSIYFVHATIRTIIKVLPLSDWNAALPFIITTLISICIALISYRIDNKYIRAVFG